MINIGIIGCGHWGPNLIRNFNSLSNSKVYFCCDVDRARLNEIERKHPGTKTTTNYEELLEDSKVDAVAIAVPASRHFQITLDVLKAGKDVLVEKPLSLSEKDCQELLEEAEEQKKILMVGSTYLYNPLVRKIKEIVDNGQLGKIYSIAASREAPGPVRHDVNALWDLAPHDIAILLYLLNIKPISISCRGQSYLHKDVEDVVFSTLIFPKEVIANIRSCWFNPFKERKMVIIGSKASIVFDEMTAEKVQMFVRDSSNSILTKEIIVPHIVEEEPLKTEIAHFLECIETRKKPLTDGRNGLEVVKILEAGQKSLQNGGAFVDIKW